MIIRSGILEVPNFKQTPNHHLIWNDDPSSNQPGNILVRSRHDVEPFYEYFWRGQLGRCAGALETGFGDLGSSLHYVRAWPVSFFLTHVCFPVFSSFANLVGILQII